MRMRPLSHNMSGRLTIILTEGEREMKLLRSLIKVGFLEPAACVCTRTSFTSLGAIEV